MLFAYSALGAAGAKADLGDGEGFGPVVGYSEGSWSFGWEAAISRVSPLVKASVGGVYHVNRRDSAPLTVHYLAYEPWLLLGGTVGVAFADGPHLLRPALGVWQGFPITLTGKDLFSAGPVERRWVLTLSIGWRWFGWSLSQFYFTPKLWRYSGVFSAMEVSGEMPPN